MSDPYPMPSTYGSHGLNLSEMPLAPPARAYPRTAVPSPPPQTVSQMLAPAGAAARELLAAHYVRKSYRKASIVIPVLQGVELSIQEGEFVSIIGPSGCGKTTLLHLLATLDAPDSGEICFEGHRIDNVPSAGRDLLRNKYFGMVFQFYHLLPELTTLENVLAPAMIGESVLGYWRRRRGYKERAREMLELVGLGHRLKHKPRELSGGEMQRTAIARALVARPRVLLADEPTGNLDSVNSAQVMRLLRDLVDSRGQTVVIVTHDNDIAAQADRTVHVRDGLLEEFAPGQIYRPSVPRAASWK